MSELPRVKVVNTGEGWLGTEYYINDQKIERVKAVDFRVAVDEVPTFTFETMGAPDIDMSGDIQFSFTPQTIEEARKVIENDTKNRHRADLQAQKSCNGSYVNEKFIEGCKSEETEEVSKEALASYIQFSVLVIQNVLLKHNDLYYGALASMRSVIQDAEKWCKHGWIDNAYDEKKEDLERLAECMLKRLIGEE